MSNIVKIVQFFVNQYNDNMGHLLGFEAWVEFDNEELKYSTISQLDLDPK
jgi:hypothetical protein